MRTTWLYALWPRCARLRRLTAQHRHSFSSQCSSQSSTMPCAVAELPRRVVLTPGSVSFTTAEARTAFLDFFGGSAGGNHTFIPSCGVVPRRDEGTYFVNSGVVQFKPLLLGQLPEDSYLGRVKRAVNSQRCVRIGGKHNDLFEVGLDGSHHTFFEMLGSWSFGDYFKHEACRLAWNLLTQVYRLSPRQLYVTYFGGCEKLGLPADIETRDIWLRLGVPFERLLPFGAKENFWEMASTGPCGPSSEIHFDYLGGAPGRCARCFVNAGTPELLEVWNLVFMEWERLPDGTIQKLPLRCVDTGMGLERLSSILQGCTSNYDTELFTPLLQHLQQEGASKRLPSYNGRFGAADQAGLDHAYRVVVDHARMAAVTACDGLLPGHQDLSGKLRAVISRAALYAAKVLDLQKPGVLARLVPLVIETLGPPYPELSKNATLAANVIQQDEEHFFSEILPQVELVLDACRRAAANPHCIRAHEIRAASEAITKNKPISQDLLRCLASIQGVTLDFNDLDSSNNNRSLDSTLPVAPPKQDVRESELAAIAKHLTCPMYPSTNTEPKYNYERTTGGYYVFPSAVALVLACFMKGQPAQHALLGDECFVLLNCTNLYHKAGGQASDTGILRGKEFDAQVLELIPCCGSKFILHLVRIVRGSLQLPMDTKNRYLEVEVHVEPERRLCLMQHHTALHLLSTSLTKHLAPACATQCGSAVLPDRLELNISSSVALTDELLLRVEDECCAAISTNHVVKRHVERLSTLDRSVVRTLPDVEYPSDVSVVDVAGSQELCCGTHVSCTADLKDFLITSCSGAGAGIFHLEAVAGSGALVLRGRADAMDLALTSLEAQLQSAEKSSDKAAFFSQRLEEVISYSRMNLPRLRRQKLKQRLEALRLRMAPLRRAYATSQGEVRRNEFVALTIEALQQCKSNQDGVALINHSLKKKKEAVSALVAADVQCGADNVILWHGGHQVLLYTCWENTGISAVLLAQKLIAHLHPKQLRYVANIDLGSVDERQCVLLRGDVPTDPEQLRLEIRRLIASV